MKSLVRIGFGILASLTSAFFILGAAMLSFTEDALLLTPTVRSNIIRLSTPETLPSEQIQPSAVQLIPVTSIILRPTRTSVVGDWLLETLGPVEPTPCPRPPAGWKGYVVQPGDILSQISLHFGISIADIQYYNCLGSSDMIRYGEMLFLPDIFTSTPPDSPSPEPTLTPTEASTETPAPTQTETPSPSATAPVEETEVPTQTETPGMNSGI